MERFGTVSTSGPGDFGPEAGPGHACSPPSLELLSPDDPTGPDAEARELTTNLTLRELRSRYKRSVLGWTWSLLNPLSTVIIFSIVFSFFLQIDPPVGHPSGLHNFAVFLLCGLLPFNYLSNTMNGSLESLLSNSNLIRKVYFPREILVVSNVASLLVTMLVELGVLCVILLLLGNMVLPWIPMLLLLVAIETVFVLGIGLMLSVFNVYFRDVKHFIGIAMQALFYSMPIVYPISVVENAASRTSFPLLRLYTLNPLVRMVDAYRAVLYDLRFPALSDVLYFGIWAVAFSDSAWWSSAVSTVGSRRKCERGHHRRGRLEAVPALPRAQPVVEGRPHAASSSPLRGVLGAARASRSRFPRDRPSASSARTAPARARCSSASPASCGPRRAGSRPGARSPLSSSSERDFTRS